MQVPVPLCMVMVAEPLPLPVQMPGVVVVIATASPELAVAATPKDVPKAPVPWEPHALRALPFQSYNSDPFGHPSHASENPRADVAPH
jgi:hypothetical protein